MENEAPIRPSNLLVQITHSMCYLLGRSTGSVSIGLAVSYADLGCPREKCYFAGLYNGTEVAPVGRLGSITAPES